MTDVIDVDEAVATDISTPGLRRRRRATEPAAQGRRTLDDFVNDAREERDAAAVELDEDAGPEFGHPEHDELGMPGGDGAPFPFFGPGPPPVDIPADEGLDWQVEKVA